MSDIQNEEIQSSVLPLVDTPEWYAQFSNDGMTFPIARVKTPQEYEAIAPNTEYLDPDGNLRRKPWQAKDAQSYAAIPEGETYTDPQGNVRKKPKFEGVDFTTQTLHDMAINDKERRRALERNYPGRVKENASTGELYVEDEDGTRRKPGSGGLLNRAGATVAASAAPVAGSVLGAIGGGIGGSAVPGAGTVAGTVAGGFSGGVLGQSFNDLILGLTGVHDRTGVEEAAELGKAGFMGGAGVGVGRGIATVFPAVKGAAQAGSAALPKIVANILGANPAKLNQAIEITNKGYRVSPSTWAEESPYLHKVTDAFDPAFRTQNVLKQDAGRFLEEEGGKVLDSAGVPKEGRQSLLNPQSAVSSEEAGAALLKKARDEMMTQDENLARIADRAKQLATLKAEYNSTAFKETAEQLRNAEQASMGAAQKAINAGFDNIQGDVNQAMKAAEVGANSGDLWTGVAQKLQSTRNAIVENHSNRYTRWDDAYGHLVPPDVGDLPQVAERVLGQLPENFQKKYPDIVKKMADIGSGEEPVTLGQLHNLRSLLRNKVNYYDLTPDVRDGIFKLFSGKVNEVIQARGAAPELREAAKVLNDIDASYGKNMKTFKDKTIQSVVSAVEAGVPADPQLLANTILKEGRTDLIDKVRKMVGPNYWNAVKGADLQEMLDQSKSLIPGQIDGKRFVAQVMDRDRNNMLEAVHGKDVANRLRQQAQYVAMADGKLPIPASPNDTITSLIQKAREATQAAKSEASIDPLKVLQRDMRGIESDYNKQLAGLRKTRSQDALGHLYDPTVGASEAAEKILKNPDLISAAANRFGESSPEFKMLRQVYVQRVLQGSLDVGKKMEKITPEVQRIMFPGASLEEMQTLARNMDFLTSTSLGDQAGTSIAAASRVLNPWGQITGVGKLVKPLTKVPGTDALGRALLTKYYAFVTDLATRPATLQWIAKGLNGAPADREAVKAAIQSAVAKSGPIGAGLAQGAYQAAPDSNLMEPPQRQRVMGR